jgi:hypothetical protein
MTTIDLAIAGYTIKLTEAEGAPCFSWPMSPFERFLAPSNGTGDIDITVNVHVVGRLPELRHGSPLFDAGRGLWRLYELDGGCAWESLDTETLQPKSRATISADYSCATVWTAAERMEGRRGWVPMKIFNPLVEVCLLTRLARTGGLLLHGAGILSSSEGYVFTGPSGAGKSTLSEFFSQGGAAVLSDERVILRRDAASFSLHGTPWIGSGAYARNAGGLLTRLFCIRHGPTHHAESMTARAALSWILSQCFLPHWDRTAMEVTLAFVADLVFQAPCVELAFAKQADVVDYIHGHRSSVIS